MGDENGRDKDGPRPEIPSWLKFTIGTVGGIAIVLSWAEARFISRVEYQNHAVQQALDMERLVRSQQSYSLKEGDTSDRLGSLTVDVAEIKSDVSWLRSYLDVSLPAPRKNGNGHKKAATQ